MSSPPPDLDPAEARRPIEAAEVSEHRLRPWSRIWRYLVVIGVGLLLWVFVANEYIGVDPDSVPEPQIAVIGGFLLLDLVLGMLAVGLLPLRRRHPALVAALTAALSSVSASAVGAAALAVVSLSTRRRWRSVIAVGAIWVAATTVYEMMLRPAVSAALLEYPAGWVSAGLALAVYAVCVSTGFYIGARRELLASLQDRLATAEREQALRERTAREAERTRIAREMHDVLAHRISLISLHAGALGYRTDLRQEEAAAAAAVIQTNAQLALTELRQILGVLRRPEPVSGEQGVVEPPQPTLHQLPALLADAREAGMRIALHADDPLDDLSESMSRTAYRVVQESLTNARKHAPGEAVTVRLAREAEEVVVEIENRRSPASDPSEPSRAARGGGVGLVGLRERTELAGGDFRHAVTPDGRFTVSARLPWE